jgi:hypothetical protein
MAIFGYVVYMVITLYVTLVTAFLTMFPGKKGGEWWFFVAIMSVFWYGAYALFPFEVAVK